MSDTGDDDFQQEEDEYTYEEEPDEYDVDAEYEDDTTGAAGASASSASSSSKRTEKDSPLKKELSVPDGSFMITDYSEIAPLMKRLISEVALLLDVHREAAQILLQLCRWDKERLMDAFFLSQEKLLTDAGLDLYTAEISISAYVASPSPTESKSESKSGESLLFKCRICCEDCNTSDAYCLGCSHRFCRPCYGEYLKSQVSEGPSCVLAHCPEHKCKQAVPRAAFVNLMDPAELEKYDIFLLRNFVETSKTMKYCPAAGCDKVAVGSGITTVRCVCNNHFCFRCGDEAHDPCTCSQLAEWALKVRK